jgi:prepilin-type N-terminal cleavage/methylation domain-containing protein
MTTQIPNSISSRSTRGFTLVELMVAMAVGSIVLAAVVTLFVYGVFSFAGMGNYAILAGQSHISMDVLSREIREATEFVDYTANGQLKSLTLSNSLASTIMKCTWDHDTGILTFEKTGMPNRTCLTGCDAWDVSFYQRTPKSDWTFYTVSNPTSCKLINMNWKCSRTILKRINTENVVTAQVVLRNKP